MSLLLIHMIKLLQRSQKLINFLCFKFKFTQLCLEDHQGPVQIFNALTKLTKFETNESICHVCFGG